MANGNYPNKEYPECRFVGEFNCVQTPLDNGSVTPLVANGHPPMTYGADAGRMQAGFTTSVVSTEEQDKMALMIIGVGLVIVTGGAAIAYYGGTAALATVLTEGTIALTERAIMTESALIAKTGMGISELTVAGAGVAGSVFGPPGPSASPTDNVATILSRLLEMGAEVIMLKGGKETEVGSDIYTEEVNGHKITYTVNKDESLTVSVDNEQFITIDKDIYQDKILLGKENKEEQTKEFDSTAKAIEIIDQYYPVENNSSANDYGSEID